MNAVNRKSEDLLVVMPHNNILTEMSPTETTEKVQYSPSNIKVKFKKNTSNNLISSNIRESLTVPQPAEKGIRMSILSSMRQSQQESRFSVGGAVNSGDYLKYDEDDEDEEQVEI